MIDFLHSPGLKLKEFNEYAESDDLIVAYRLLFAHEEDRHDKDPLWFDRRALLHKQPQLASSYI